MTLSLTFSDTETGIIEQFAKLHGVSSAELIKKYIIESLEDELDLQTYNEAMKEYKANPVTYTLDEVIKELADN